MYKEQSTEKPIRPHQFSTLIDNAAKRQSTVVTSPKPLLSREALHTTWLQWDLPYNL